MQAIGHPFGAAKVSQRMRSRDPNHMQVIRNLTKTQKKKKKTEAPSLRRLRGSSAEACGGSKESFDFFIVYARQGKTTAALVLVKRKQGESQPELPGGLRETLHKLKAKPAGPKTQPYPTEGKQA